MKQINQLTLRMVVKSQPMFDEKIEAEYQQVLRDAAKERFDAIIADQKRLLEPGKFDEQRFNGLSEQRDKAAEEIQFHGKLMMEALDRRLILQKQLTREILQESEPIVLAQIPLIAALRSELELHTDIAELTTRMTESLMEIQETYRQTIDSMP
jgi:hypothetical protein